MSKNFTNNYIPEHVSDKLLWYESDGLMTYIDKLKYNNFARDRDAHLKKTEVVNFDMIINGLEGVEFLKRHKKKYKTIKNSRRQYYPQK